MLGSYREYYQLPELFRTAIKPQYQAFAEKYWRSYALEPADLAQAPRSIADLLVDGLLDRYTAPANSRFLVHWSPVFRVKFSGTPVKNIALTYAGKRVRGELMISQEGIEGGAIYALSQGLREKPGHPVIIDLMWAVGVWPVVVKRARRRPSAS